MSKPPKNELQEILMKEGLPPPSYITSMKGGQPHMPLFESRVSFKNKTFTGTGSSKKEAENDAAVNALAMFNRNSILLITEDLDVLAKENLIEYSECYFFSTRKINRENVKCMVSQYPLLSMMFKLSYLQGVHENFNFKVIGALTPEVLDIYKNTIDSRNVEFCLLK